MSGAEYRHDADRQQDRRKSEQHVHAAHDQSVEPAAEEAGQASPAIRQTPAPDSTEMSAHFERDLRAEHDATQNVAPELVGAEREKTRSVDTASSWEAFPQLRTAR